MAYVTPTTVLTNDLIAAGDWNKNTVDNPIALRTGEIALTSQAVGDLVIATSATQLGRVADVAVGQVLVSGGVTTAPAYSASPSITALTYTTSLKSTTALATPGALSATQATEFASTVSGASLMGFGTTNDVSLMNRAGTVVLGVGPNTTAVNIPGTLAVTGTVTGGTYNSQTISSAANFTGTVGVAGLTTLSATGDHWNKGSLSLGPAQSSSIGAGDLSVARSATTAYLNFGSNGTVNLGLASSVLTLNGAMMTKPAQPAFFATAAIQSNVTGDGTLYTMVFGTEIYDQGNNFATSTFTAPVTGRYLLTSIVGYQGVLVGHDTHYMQIVTSNRTMTVSHQNIGTRIANDTTHLQMNTFADMDSGDTAVIKFAVSGSTKVIDTLLDVASFSGALIC